jgi:hypothetical protein
VSAICSALAELPLDAIDVVLFYKRDLFTVDMICCEVEARGKVWTFHEEVAGWDELIAHLARLPGFREDWFSAVSSPAFAECRTAAFVRHPGLDPGSR